MSSAAAPASAARKGYPFLDGIRGLAALAVVLYHAFLFTGLTDQSTEQLPIVGAIIGWGYLGVPVFIVLSGFLLRYKFERGARRYFRDRARRILPPYYAALLVSLALIALVPVLQVESGTAWDTKVPVTVPSVLSHLFLVQNLSGSWAVSINGPMWSIAVEWQIYFILPLLLLPLRRLVHPLVLVGIMTTITVLPPVALGVGTVAHPWLVTLFAMGMAAAEYAKGASFHAWQVAATSAWVAVVLLVTSFVRSEEVSGLWFSETVAGAVAALVIGLMARGQAEGRVSRTREFLGSKPLEYAGLVSYSVYLLHSPLLGLGNLLTLPLDLPLLARWALMTFLVAPIAIAISIGFFYLAERPFINSRQREVQRELKGGEPHLSVASASRPSASGE
ncbi:acyltransferase [Microbacterium oryzae]|uniref:acyltransferase family protein n=1 Tax=Microbacterium oryzae TaxID=743009 RepID=UPI0025B0DF8A|nr:acyltransferase [Microbacterium oryzae]MDN3311613.1 acyltransferase [Microbacterium oryzae]